MGAFRQLIAAGLPARMSLPYEFGVLFDWIEATRGVGKTVSGDSIGVVNPVELSRRGGCAAYFHKPFSDNHWTGCWDTQEMQRLSTFMRTGFEGSSAAFWLDDDGNQKIVHLGSGSGSIMTGVWVQSPLDLMRLLAIGYSDLCWPEDYDVTPIEAVEEPSRFLAPVEYQKWLAATFGVSIPVRANEIVGAMSKISEPSEDPFCRWLASLEERGLTK